MPGKPYWGITSLAGAQESTQPTLLCLGDSWFWYPFNNLVNALATRLRDDHVLLAIGNNGAEAAEWMTKYRKDVDIAFGFYASGVSALFLSGGGNDVAGSRDFLRIIRDKCKDAQNVADCYQPGQPEALLSTLEGAYRSVIAKFRAHSDKPVVLHNYDFAWPTGKGVFGPADWLKAPMETAKVPKDLRRPLFSDLIKRVGKMQAELAKDASLGKIIAIKTAGTLPESESCWANELHPSPDSFNLLVEKAFLPKLLPHGIK